jgi:hypothetical protein
MGERLAKKGIEWMDVPISGSSAQARMGNMVFMAGGKRSVFERIKLVLDQIGKKTVYVGKMGDGATLKLVINHTLYLNQAAAIEGLVLGMKTGLNPDVLFDVITSGAASSDLLIARGRDMLSGIFSPKGPVVIANKDLALSMETAKRWGVVLPVGALYQQLLLKAHYNGWDLEDATAVMKIYEEMAGMVRKGKRTPPGVKKKESTSEMHRGVCGKIQQAVFRRLPVFLLLPRRTERCLHSSQSRRERREKLICLPESLRQTNYISTPQERFSPKVRGF